MMSKQLLQKKTRIFMIILSGIMVFTYTPILSDWYGYGMNYVVAEDLQPDLKEQNMTTDSAVDESADPVQDDQLDSGRSDSDQSEDDQSDVDANVSSAGMDKNISTSSSGRHMTTMSEADTSWYDPSGITFTLNNDQELLGLSKLVNEGNSFKGKTVKLAANMISFQITPIGSKDKPFSGTFDGGNNRLTDMQIDITSNQYVGLFGYTSEESIIKNVDIRGGTLKVTEASKTGKQIWYVGALAGYMKGSIDNCYSSMNVSVTSQKTLGKEQGIIRNVGGMVGYIHGNITKCTSAGDVTISSASNINEDVRYLVGEIGGIAGAQGDVTDPTRAPVTEDSKNTGDMQFNITGQGGIDRFGAQLYSVVFCSGGLIGQTSGSVYRCTNSGTINTANGTADNPAAGRGASNTGGIVGSLRSDPFETMSASTSQNANFSKSDAAYDHFVKNGGVAKAPASYPKTVGIYDCNNTGTIVGLAAVGGIAGSGGSFTEVEGCSNIASIKGTRWNKPFAAGIVGHIMGSIRYCYNRGGVYSVTGGGYYCAGITGVLWIPHEETAEDNAKAPVSEMTGCYTTGRIYTNGAGYRTGILAGENQGYVHENGYLEKLTADGKVIDGDSGTTSNNIEFSANDLKDGNGRGLLNTYAAGKGGWKHFYLPDLSNANGGYPILCNTPANRSNGSSTLGSAQVSLVTYAAFSATSDPIPQVSVKSGGTTLVQNADFYVVPQSGKRNVTVGSADPVPYTATILGMGKYREEQIGTIKYGIKKAPISDCTIVCDTAIFNWKRQSPIGKTKLIDAAGNEVPKSAYQVSDRYNGSEKPVMIDGAIHYFDYKNTHGASYKYLVKVTASSTGDYAGSTEQAAFRINRGSMSAQVPVGDPEYVASKPKTVLYGKITWKGKTWDFIKAMRDKTGATIKIPYTGKPVTPTVTKITYLGQTMREAKNNDYLSNPLKYDYKYVYGNPNPEADGGVSSTPVNVTGKNPTCMTIRYTNGGNFHNYTNVFYQIVAADIKTTKISVPAHQYSGKTIKAKPTVTLSGTKLKSGKDYTVSNIKYSSNKKIGKAKVTFTIKGKGNLKGTYKKTVKFNITPKKTKVTKVTAGKKSMKVTYKKISKKQGVTGYQIRYKAKGTAKWKTKTAKANQSSLTIKSLKKGKTYQVQVRGVTKIKSGSSKGTYYSPWSSAKTSPKIK